METIPDKMPPPESKVDVPSFVKIMEHNYPQMKLYGNGRPYVLLENWGLIIFFKLYCKLFQQNQQNRIIRYENICYIKDEGDNQLIIKGIHSEELLCKFYRRDQLEIFIEALKEHNCKLTRCLSLFSQSTKYKVHFDEPLQQKKMKKQLKQINSNQVSLSEEFFCCLFSWCF